ncbi:flagellar biosynthesis protein FlhF [Persephonella atlantica]|uniref:Flagellar biosynthesis protein FlhF n=1 Tax=Persephonella atlantica TaxID=2699429 RepID=A0ABS1GHR6_9AQUI|nr:flagellar biosynthesis protein FlhF [Persephonella atlantica]MBK3332479.1 flagellar biosynthesis protein FlhF [Persephonella atlantica]
MEIRIYEGYNLEELIQKAKEELGEDIKILHYETVEERKFLFFKGKKKYKLFVETTDEDDITEPVLRFEELLEKVEEIIDKKIQSSLPKTSQSMATPEGLPPHIKNSVYPVPTFNEFTGDAFGLLSKLTERGVSPDVAKKLVKEGCGLDIDTNKWDLNTITEKEALIKGIKKYIKFTGAVDRDGENLKIFAFVGPTGVGKTTNLFKIASQLVIDRKKKVAVISTDTFKVGASHQARTYANILNIPFYSVSESKKLRSTVEQLKGFDFILIDTVGRSHYDYWRLGEIKEILGGIGEEIQNILVISCNFKDEDAFEVVHKYQTFFHISSLFFTKIDETLKPGILLNLPVETRLPVSYISTGQRVPEDLKILTPELISSYILGENGG